MDHFAFGGVLTKQSDVDTIFKAHRDFCARWSITYPLHSSRIRGRRGNFSWLALDAGREQAFLSDLQKFILSLPVVTIAAVVDRPGYVTRYRERYADKTWLMCKTAFCIVAERAAKYAAARGGVLEIYFERAGEMEDGAIRLYGRALKKEGMPFDPATSAAYGALTAEQFRALIVGEPRERTKSTPMMQIADLVLYPMAKAGYDPSYPPYRALFEAGKAVDALLQEEQRASMGIKYSCFDAYKRQDPAVAGS